MPGGSSTQWRSAIPSSLDSLTLHPENVFTIEQSHSSSDGDGDTAAHIGIPCPGGSGPERVGTSRHNFASSHQRTGPDPVLDRPERFEDAPYVPPRVTQAELHTYPALHPRTNNVYDPVHHHNAQPVQFPCESGTSSSESHRDSVESNWSTSSSSSASSQQLHHDYLSPSSQYSQTAPLPVRSITNPQHYPAYHGQYRLGLEHVRYGPQPSNTGGNYYRVPPQDYSTSSLLAPEVFNDATVMSSRGTLHRSPSDSAANRLPTISTFPVSPSSITDGTRSVFPDAGPYLRKQLGLSAHEPISLYALPNPPAGEKPSAPLPMLIKLAIYGSPSKQLTLQEIYTELENRFQWFRDHRHERSWKNSIRHNLSLNKVFRHVPRPITEPGKGSYWQLDVSGGEGYKRLRKRRPKNRMAAASEEEEEDASEVDEERTSPIDVQYTPSSRSSATPSEDAHIDPDLRSEGHVVGEGRTRSMTRRAGAGGPYPLHSPHIQQGPLPITPGQDTSARGQPPARSGQPSFGHSSFPAYPQTRIVPAVSSGSSFTTMTSSSMATMPIVSTVARPRAQQMGSYDQVMAASQPPARSGMEFVVDPGLPTARRMNTYPSQSTSSVESSSPESSQTWSARSTPRTHKG